MTAPWALEPVPIRGVVPILVTPFTATGEVDLEQVDREVEFLADAGVPWVGLGFGSEVPRLDTDELAALLRRVVAAAAGRLRVVGNAEMSSIRTGRAAVARVRDAGADAAMLRPGGLVGVGQDALFDAVAEVVSGGELPVVVQDAPQNTLVEMSAHTLARLLREVPEVVAVKVEPPAPAPKMSEILRHLDGAPGSVVGGLGGSEWIHELRRGAHATMPGPAVPEVFAGIQRRHEGGDRAGAIELFARVLPLLVLGSRSMETFLSVQKSVLARRGVLTTTSLRQPHRSLDDQLQAEVDELVDALDLLGLCDQLRKEAQDG